MKRLIRMMPVVLTLSLVATAATRPKEPSWLRVENVCPDCPAVDVLVNGKPQFKGLAFKAVTEYLEIPGSKSDVQFVDPRNPNDRLTAGCTVKLRGKERRTVVLFGSVKNKDLGVLDIKDEPTSTVKDANVRFVHLSADSPAFGVFEADGSKLFKDTAYKTASDYDTLLPGTHTLELREKGVKTAALKTDMKLEPGKNYSLFLVGKVQDNSRQFVDLVEPGKPPSTQDSSKVPSETKADKKTKRTKTGKKTKSR